MKPIRILLISLFVSASLFAQGSLSLNERDSFLPLKKNTRFGIYKNRTDRAPTYRFVLSDSVSYLISSNAWMQNLFYRDKAGQVDSLVTLYELRIDNLKAQTALIMQQLKTEQKAFDQLKEVSDAKSEIAEASIEKAKSLRRKGIYFSAFLGLVGGFLWIKDSDSQAMKIAKPVVTTVGSTYLSFTIFR